MERPTGDVLTASEVSRLLRVNVKTVYETRQGRHHPLRSARTTFSFLSASDHGTLGAMQVCAELGRTLAMPARRDSRGVWRYRKVVTLPDGNTERISGTPAQSTSSGPPPEPRRTTFYEY
jgi:hypothetical protein